MMKFKDSILQTASILGIALTFIILLLPPANAQEITLYPTTFTNLTGNWDGTPEDLNNSATFNILNETNGNPGFLAVANFTDVHSEPATYTLSFKIRYNGTVGHANNVHVQYLDCISETWTTFGTTTNFILETFTAVVDNANIRCSDGNSSIRIIHDTGGTPTHIEEIYLVSMEGIVPSVEIFHMHFVADPPSLCSLCELHIDWVNDSLTQNLNYSIDDGDVEHLCTACTNADLKLVGLTNGSHNITITSSTLGSVTRNFIIVAPSQMPTAYNIWNHNSTERTTNNWFDKVLGGDILTNTIPFFLILAGGLLWLGFKTTGRANIPFFGLSSLVFLALGLYIRETSPFPIFGPDIGSDLGILNLTAMWVFYALTAIPTIYAGLGEWRRIQNR